MSDHQIDVKLKEAATDHREKRNEEDRIALFSSNLLDRGDSLIYAIVGISFFLGALCALGYSFWHFSVLLTEVTAPTIKSTLEQPPLVAKAIIQLVSDLLLVLIIMEVLGTVVHYLKEHATSLRPFLFIGIVSATRGILSIGARLSVEQNVNVSDFTRAMIELGVNASVILALGITLKLLGKFLEQQES